MTKAVENSKVKHSDATSFLLFAFIAAREAANTKSDDLLKIKN